MTIEEVVDHIVIACEGAYGMKVIVAKTAGFCFGVKRAVDDRYTVRSKKEKSRFIRMDRSSTMRRWSGNLRKREYGS